MADSLPSSMTAPTQAQSGRVVKIAIKSPGIEQPTTLENISLSSTVGQLKTAIHANLPLHPPESRQRLIFHGRALLHDDATLGEALGEQMTRDMDTITIHMAIRNISASDSAQPNNRRPPPDVSSHQPAPSSSSGVPDPSRTMPAGQVHVHIQQFPHIHVAPPPLPPPPSGVFAHIPSPTPVPTPGNIPPHMLHAHHALHNHQLQQLQQLQHQRQVLLHQANAHRESLAMLAQTTGPAFLPPGASFATPRMMPEQRRGRSSPNPNIQHISRTIVREGLSPNGTRWRIVQNVPLDNAQQHLAVSAAGLSPSDMQNILRVADARQSPQYHPLPGGSAIHHGAATTLQSPVSAPQPGPAASLTYAAHPQSRNATPESHSTAARLQFGPAAASTTHADNHHTPTATQTNVTPPIAPHVYLLQSPDGPRALLFNETGTWYTPLVNAQPPSLAAVRPTPTTHLRPTAASAPGAPTNAGNRDRDRGPTRRRVRPHHRRRHVHVHNLGNAAFLAQVWTHLWLLLRLGGLVWMFTGPDTSYLKWVTLLLAACAVFIISTGVLNEVVDQVWRPVRQHFENLLPVLRVEAGPGQDPHQVDHVPLPNAPLARDPDPAVLAARLMDQQRRRADNNWLISQVRRAERACLLFIASLAPGIAERHIRNLVNEQRTREEAARRAGPTEDGAARPDAGNPVAQNEPAQTARTTDFQAGPAPQPQVESTARLDVDSSATAQDDVGIEQANNISAEVVGSRENGRTGQENAGVDQPVRDQNTSFGFGAATATGRDSGPITNPWYVGDRQLVRTRNRPTRQPEEGEQDRAQGQQA